MLLEMLRLAVLLSQVLPIVLGQGGNAEEELREFSILREFFEATGGPTTWKRNDGWTLNSDVCTWRGIECWTTSYEGRVRRLRLPNNHLQGKVPSSIFNLTYLTTLDLSHNDVSLDFARIGDAPTLHALNIAATNTKSLQGIARAHSFLSYLYADRLSLDDNSIPDEVWKMGQLKVLSLSECQLQGSLSSKLSNMQSLEELYLYNNMLEGTLPEAIGTLSNLRRLSLARNQLKGTLPKSLGNLTNMEALSLMGRTKLKSGDSSGGADLGFAGPLPDFASVPRLRTLMLSNNQLTGSIPDTFLRSLTGANVSVTVDLSNNLLNGTVPTTMGQRLDRLSIFLDGNAISEIDPTLCTTQVNWMDGNVRDFGCNAILCPPNSATVSGTGRQVYVDQACRSCGNNDRSGSSSAYGQQRCEGDNSASSERAILKMLYEACGGSKWKKQDNWLEDDQHVCTWYGITCDENNRTTAIALGDNHLADRVPTELYLLPNLEKLSLFSNSVNVSFQGLELATNLRTLSLDSVTNVDSLSGIGKGLRLETLTVRSANLEGHMPIGLSRLNRLKSLSLSGNRISGQIPSWMRAMTALVSFSASSNRLDGPLFDFAELTSLQYLDLSHNQITGTLPSTFLDSSRSARNRAATNSSTGSDKSFVVDLSDNSLQGTVPLEWADGFSSLSIKLHDNRITGVPPDLCTRTTSWNDNDVGAFGCNGLLCPTGTSNDVGRQTSVDHPCVPCVSASTGYMGSTACDGRGSTSGCTAPGGSRGESQLTRTVAAALGVAFLWSHL